MEGLGNARSPFRTEPLIFTARSRVPLQEWPSAERSCLSRSWAASLGMATSTEWSGGLASRRDGLYLCRTTPLRQKPLPHRLSSPSSRLCLHRPTETLFLRVLPSKPQKSWSRRICFLGNLTYNIYHGYILRRSYWVFLILWISSLLWWSQNSLKLSEFSRWH